jgi:hypothetical protein
MILEESKERFSGKLKFFDEQKNYGFIVMDMDKSDIFVLFKKFRCTSTTSARPTSVRSSSRQPKMEMRFCFFILFKVYLQDLELCWKVWQKQKSHRFGASHQLIIINMHIIINISNIMLYFYNFINFIL